MPGTADRRTAQVNTKKTNPLSESSFPARKETADEKRRALTLLKYPSDERVFDAVFSRLTTEMDVREEQLADALCVTILTSHPLVAEKAAEVLIRQLPDNRQALKALCSALPGWSESADKDYKWKPAVEITIKGLAPFSAGEPEVFDAFRPILDLIERRIMSCGNAGSACETFCKTLAAVGTPHLKAFEDRALDILSGIGLSHIADETLNFLFAAASGKAVIDSKTRSMMTDCLVKRDPNNFRVTYGLFLQVTCDFPDSADQITRKILSQRYDKTRDMLLLPAIARSFCVRRILYKALSERGIISDEASAVLNCSRDKVRATIAQELTDLLTHEDEKISSGAALFLGQFVTPSEALELIRVRDGENAPA